MLCGHTARRGVNTTALKWDRPCRCLVINILGTETGNTGVGHVSMGKMLVASRKYAKRQEKSKQSTLQPPDRAAFFFLSFFCLKSGGP